MKKKNSNLKARLADFNAMPCQDFQGTSKRVVVSASKTQLFHKPGSNKK